MLNNNEKKFVDAINEAMRYVKGELELDCFEGKWFAMDYREDLEGAFFIEAKEYNKPLITVSEAKNKGINVIKCCNECHISYVG